MLSFPRIASCRGKGLIVVLGADLWLTGLSGAQSVGHSTNLRYPCPWWLLGKDRLTGWFILWMTDWSNDDGVVEFVADSQVTHSLYQSVELFSGLHTHLFYEGVEPLLHLESECWFNTLQQSTLPRSNSVSQWLAETAQCWNELYLIASAQIPLVVFSLLLF